MHGKVRGELREVVDESKGIRAELSGVPGECMRG